MKKVFSIAFVLLILLSGMHLSIATHLCGGEIAAVKWSFSGEKATCGMQNAQSSCPSGKEVKSNCCQNLIATYTIDNNYHPAFYQKFDITKKLSQIYLIPLCISAESLISLNSIYTDVSPTDNSFTSSVKLSDICIFRI